MINAAYSSIYGSKCKYCAGSPKNYSFRLDKLLSKNIKYILSLKDFFMKNDFKIRDVITYSNGKKNHFKTNAFNTIDISVFKNYAQFPGNKISDCLFCDCGKTLWAYNEISSYKRWHILNRRCKYAYPMKLSIY